MWYKCLNDKAGDASALLNDGNCVNYMKKDTTSGMKHTNIVKDDCFLVILDYILDINIRIG